MLKAKIYIYQNEINNLRKKKKENLTSMPKINNSSHHELGTRNEKNYFIRDTEKSTTIEQFKTSDSLNSLPGHCLFKISKFNVNRNLFNDIFFT